MRPTETRPPARQARRKRQPQIQNKPQICAVVLTNVPNTDPTLNSLGRNKALLPVANIPLLDYVLESLLMNGVDDIRLLVTDDAVERYVTPSKSDQATSSLCRSREANISVIRLQRTEGNGAPPPDVCDQLREAHDRNALPQGPFLLVPVSVLTTAANLRMLVKRHVEREKRSGGRVLLTGALSTIAGRSLGDIHALVTTRAMAKFEEPARTDRAMDDDQEYVVSPKTFIPPIRNIPGCSEPSTASPQQGMFPAMVDDTPTEFTNSPRFPEDDHLMLEGTPGTRISSYSHSHIQTRSSHDHLSIAYAPESIQNTTKNGGCNEVFAYQSWFQHDQQHASNFSRMGSELTPSAFGSNVCPTLEVQESNPLFTLQLCKQVSPTKPLRVRTDAVHTGLYVCSNKLLDAVLLPNTMLRDFWDVQMHLLMALEFDWAVDFLWSNSEDSSDGITQTENEAFTPATVVYVSSPHAYITASVTVCKRQLNPLSPERYQQCIPPHQPPRYAAHVHFPNILVHRDSHVRLSPSDKAVGPHVVLGRAVQLRPRKLLALTNTVVGNNAIIEDSCSIVGCIIFEGAHIGKNCVLRDTIVGPGAHVGKLSWLVDCVLGASSRTGKKCRLRATVLHPQVVVDDYANLHWEQLWSPAPNLFNQLRTNSNNQPAVGAVRQLPRIMTEMTLSPIKEAPDGFDNILLASAPTLIPSQTQPSPAETHKEETDQPLHCYQRRPAGLFPLESLFVQDPIVPDKDHLRELDELEMTVEADSDYFFSAILTNVPDMMNDEVPPSALPTWRELMMSYGQGVDDLLCALVVAVCCCACQMAPAKPNKAWRQLRQTLMRWYTEVFLQLVRRDTPKQYEMDMMGMLRGIAIALSREDCKELQNNTTAAKLLSLFFAQMDMKRFEKVGYCLISFEVIDEFDQTIQKETAATTFAGSCNVEMLAKGWEFVVDYVAQLRRSG